MSLHSSRNPLVALALAACAAMPAQAAAHDDGQGHLWRQVNETMGMTWNQVAAVCDTDGATACTGQVNGNDLTGWIWATQQQAMNLFNIVLPDNPGLPNNGKLSPAHPGVSGLYYGALADSYVGTVFAPTFSYCITYACGESLSGWTSTLNANGQGITGNVGWGSTPVTFDGGFSVGSSNAVDSVPQFNGLWLWKSTEVNPPPPIPEPQTWLLMGLGLAGVAVARRRRSNLL